MGIDIIDDDEFDEIVAEKRHKELFLELRSISEALRFQNDAPIVSAIEKQSKAIELFVGALSGKPNGVPEVKVDVDNSALSTSIDKMCGDILGGLAEINRYLQVPKEEKKWKFEIRRNHAGYIESVTATQQK